jgi:hypothetical protein
MDRHGNSPWPLGSRTTRLHLPALSANSRDRINVTSARVGYTHLPEVGNCYVLADGSAASFPRSTDARLFWVCRVGFAGVLPVSHGPSRCYSRCGVDAPRETSRSARSLQRPARKKTGYAQSNCWPKHGSRDWSGKKGTAALPIERVTSANLSVRVVSQHRFAACHRQ